MQYQPHVLPTSISPSLYLQPFWVPHPEILGSGEHPAPLDVPQKQLPLEELGIQTFVVPTTHSPSSAAAPERRAAMATPRSIMVRRTIRPA